MSKMPHHENAGCHTQPCWVRPKSLSFGGREFQGRMAASRPKALARAVSPIKSSHRQAALDAATPAWPQSSRTWDVANLLSVLSHTREGTLKRRLGVAPNAQEGFFPTSAAPRRSDSQETDPGGRDRRLPGRGRHAGRSLGNARRRPKI